MTETKKAGWSSGFGFVMASVGSAVGLGNIWGFPRRMGEEGAFGFLLFYLLFLLLAGLPLLLGELAIGRRGGPSAPAAYGIFYKGLKPLGWAAILACGLVLAYYCYFGGRLLRELFPGLPLPDWGCSLLFMLLTGLVVSAGVQRGIETCSKLLVPLLLMMLLFLAVYTLSSPGARAALGKLLRPDRTELNPRCAAAALTQMLFSMSLGQGCMLLNGAYGTGSDTLRRAWLIPFFDTLTALLAAAAILPAAMEKGVDPAFGPALLFETAPLLFSGPRARLLLFLFYLPVFFAALTSAVSMLETVSRALPRSEEKKRSRGTWLAAALLFLLSLPIGMDGGRYLFLRSYEFVSETCLMLPVSLGTCLCAGFLWRGKEGLSPLPLFLLRWVTPLLLLAGMGAKLLGLLNI